MSAVSLAESITHHAPPTGLALGRRIDADDAHEADTDIHAETDTHADHTDSHRHSDIGTGKESPDAETTSDTDALGETIAALAARLHAATYELLVLLRAFDARAGWNTGFLSCAHWLHWRTGIELGAAREKVRVAKALAALPRISAAMQRGQISYAKVRALTRVATPGNERSLLDVALTGNCAHVERIVRAWRRVDRVQAARETETRHLHRELATWVDDDGMVVIRGRLTPEIGAVVQRALEAAADRLFRDAAHAPAGQAMAEELTPAQRRADALALIAESALAADLDGGTAGDRYQVVMHMTTVDATSGAGRGASAAGLSVQRWRGLRAPDDVAEVIDGVLEIDHGAVDISMETSQRLSCDASSVPMRHDAEGTVLDVGRKTRTIPPSIRRALAARDTTCRFPGCTSRRCDAHHLQHWTDGGSTRLDNLLLLCRRHHRAVHEGGFGVRRGLDGVLTFVRPDGAPLDVVPATPADLPELHDATRCVIGTPPTWDGTRLELSWALDVLYRRAVVSVRPGGERWQGCGDASTGVARGR